MLDLRRDVTTAIKRKREGEGILLASLATQDTLRHGIKGRRKRFQERQIWPSKLCENLTLQL